MENKVRRKRLLLTRAKKKGGAFFYWSNTYVWDLELILLNDKWNCSKGNNS